MSTVSRKWYRPKGPIAGVCAGVANATGISPTVIRVIWLIAVLIYGTGFLLYGMCWLLLPKESHQFEPDKAMFLGVCLRLGQKLEVEVPIVRIAVLSLMCVTLTAAFWIYLIAHLLLPKTEGQPTAR